MRFKIIDFVNVFLKIYLKIFEIVDSLCRRGNISIFIIMDRVEIDLWFF